MTVFKDAAMEYVTKYGWSVFPILPKSKEPATCHGFKDADNDPEYVDTYWGQRPECNVAIATGQPSKGLIVIDLDDHGDDVSGFDTLREWERENGKLPETVTAITGSGGCHMLFKADHEIKCSKNEELRVDVRGDGGYIVAPPSLHPNGRSYEWENPPDEYEIAAVDERVQAFIDFVRPKSFGGRFVMPETIQSGGRNDTLHKYASSLQSKGYADNEIFDLVAAANISRCIPPLPGADVGKIVRSALGYDKGVKSLPKGVDVPTVRHLLDKSEKGVVLQTSFNFATILANDSRLSGRLWYDMNGWSRNVTLPLPWDGREGVVRAITDADYAALDVLISHDYRLSKKTALIDAVASVCQENRHNPITETIDSFKWDGTPRIRGMLHELFGCQDNEYNAAVSTLIMHSLVSRAYRPGIKCDYMFVMCGPQGCGKSSGVRALAINSEWLCESLTSFEGDAPVEKIRGALVVEVPELSAFKRSRDMETIKDFITRRSDTIRPKYARETEQRPRTCVLFGTTNVGGFMYDLTGNRRFITIECGFSRPKHDTIHGSDELNEYIGQLYAEAKAWLDDNANAPWELMLPETVVQTAEAYRELHVVDDPRVGVVESYLAKVLESDQRTDKHVCIREILVEALKVNESDWSGLNSADVSEIMRNVEGWHQAGRHYTREYGRQRCYAPDGWDS